MAAAPRFRGVARALAWATAVGVVLFVVAFLGGVFSIPGVIAPAVGEAYRPWILALLVLLATKLLLELFKPLFRAALIHRMPSEADVFALFQLFTYAAWTASFIYVLYVVAGGGATQFGFLGTALVSAAFIYVMQEPLQNIVGWGLLAMRRMYKLGDRIEMNGVRGYVVSISPMNTTVREFGGWFRADIFTGRYATIPNRNVLTGNVFNYTKDTPFVWDHVEVSVTYESDLKNAERLILDAANEVVGDLMRNNREYLRSRYEFKELATFVPEEPTMRWEMKDSWVNLSLIFYCPAHRRGYYKSEITKRILEKILDEPTVEIAYPHTEIVPYSKRGFRLDR